MEEPNLNTFAPKVPHKNDISKRKIGFEKGTHIVVIGAGAFGDGLRFIYCAKDSKSRWSMPGVPDIRDPGQLTPDH